MSETRRGLRLVAALAARPRLSGAFSVGILLAMACASLGLRVSTSAILGWDAACVGFISASLAQMIPSDPARIQARAAAQDEGRGMILGLVITATAVSLLAVGFELSLAKGLGGWAQAARISLAILTAALSWFMVQMVFALHYAHEYYTASGEGAPMRGLAFPGGEEPDDWDFMHFAVVIGVACQTADIAFTTKPMRRIGTLHGVIAFVFNTLVVALTINLVAALI